MKIIYKKIAVIIIIITFVLSIGLEIVGHLLQRYKGLFPTSSKELDEKYLSYKTLGVKLGDIGGSILLYLIIFVIVTLCVLGVIFLIKKQQEIGNEKCIEEGNIKKKIYKKITAIFILFVISIDFGFMIVGYRLQSYKDLIPIDEKYLSYKTLGVKLCDIGARIFIGLIIFIIVTLSVIGIVFLIKDREN